MVTVKWQLLTDTGVEAEARLGSDADLAVTAVNLPLLRVGAVAIIADMRYCTQ